MKIFIRLVLAFLILTTFYFIAVYVEVPYNISSKGIVVPVREWSLVRLPDGTILNTEKNNLTNKISYFSVLEFQRGDHAEFIINNKIHSGKSVNQGDTIAWIRSNEQETVLLNLVTSLEQQRGMLNVHLSGGKQEEINAAREIYVLSEKEFQTQEKLLSRMESLYKEDIIAEEEWDLALNEYEIKKQNMVIARSAMEIISTGAKKEELELIKTNINSLQRQIDQTLNRIEAFNVLAPFSGQLIRQQAPELDFETIVRVADTQKMIVSLPVEFYQLEHISSDMKVNLQINSGRNIYSARIIDFDNTIMLINQIQNVFVVAVIEEELEGFMPNMIVQADILCGNISVREYLKRLTRVIFEN